MTFFSVKNYEIVKLVGQGTMGQVYLALNQQGNPVAIKVLKHFFKDDESYISRLKNEADQLSKLADERIVKFFSTEATDDGQLAIIQEFVKGQNLEAILKKCDDRKCPTIGAVLVSEILLGLEEAHRQGVIHRDLKPENIMITKEGRIKILDFGIAKNLESEKLTMTGILLGSPAYMSPEQVNNEQIDQRSDIFSLGVMLYQLCSGLLPFKGNNYASLIKSILESDIEPPENINPKIHPLLLPIIKKALAKNPAHRFQKVYEFRYSLMTYLDEIEAPAPQIILRDFYKGDKNIEFNMQVSLVSTMIRRATFAIDSGKKLDGFNFLKQVLAIEPDNLAAKNLLNKATQKRNKFLIPLAITIILFLSGVSSIFFLSPNKKESEQTTSLKKIIPKKEIIEIIEKIEKIEKKADKVSLKLASTTRPIVKHKKTKIKPKIKKIKKIKKTKIKFNVDADVTLYLDDKKITPNKDGLYAVSVGIHKITLIKKGFNPISSNIDAVEGKITTINAKTNTAH